MAGSKARRVRNGCGNCGGDAHEISFRGNHGESWVLETHCNCGWAIDGNGKLRNPGRKPEQPRTSRRNIER
jgi:hypothetical protein